MTYKGKTFTSFFIAEQLKETFGGGITYVSLATIKDHPDHCWQRIVSQRKASSSIYGKESRLKESAKISLAAFEDKVLIIDDINTEKEVEAILDEYNVNN